MIILATETSLIGFRRKHLLVQVLSDGCHAHDCYCNSPRNIIAKEVENPVQWCVRKKSRRFLRTVQEAI